MRVEPSLVRGTTGPDGRFVPAAKPKKTRVVSAKTAKTLSQMLESVVGDEQGTGVKARIPGYRVAGKTGTANRVDPATGRYKGYTSSFLGFAPADNPRVTVSCVHPEPDEGQLLRRPDLRPGLQAGHGVRSQDAQVSAHRRRPARPAGHLRSP